MNFKLFLLGLGNVGNEYEKTRHNVAWIIFDALVGDDWDENKYAKAVLQNGKISDQDVLFIKPTTFMNNSGEVLPYLMKEYSLENNSFVVVHDDIDLPLGKIRISYDRGDGGHNGIKSIVENLGSKEFLRIRIGVSLLDENNVLRKPDVLGNFSKDEMDIIKKEITPTIAKVIESLMKDGKERTMGKFN